MFLLDLLECWSGCQIAGWVFVMVFTWAVVRGAIYPLMLSLNIHTFVQLWPDSNCNLVCRVYEDVPVWLNMILRLIKYRVLML
jgi:hypothetical protein